MINRLAMMILTTWLLRKFTLIIMTIIGINIKLFRKPIEPKITFVLRDNSFNL